MNDYPSCYRVGKVQQRLEASVFNRRRNSVVLDQAPEGSNGDGSLDCCDRPLVGDFSNFGPPVAWFLRNSHFTHWRVVVGVDSSPTYLDPYPMKITALLDSESKTVWVVHPPSESSSIVLLPQWYDLPFGRRRKALSRVKFNSWQWWVGAACVCTWRPSRQTLTWVRQRAWNQLSFSIEIKIPFRRILFLRFRWLGTQKSATYCT